MNSENTIELSRNDSDGFGSATVPVALVGVSPASRTMILPTLFGAGPKDGRVFGETPKTAVETTALPKATGPNVVSSAICKLLTLCGLAGSRCECRFCLALARLIG